MIVAGAALVVAVAGTAIGGPLATKSALSEAEKKQTRKLAVAEVKKAAPGLSVANAANAETVDGANASDLRTSSASHASGVNYPLGGAFVDVATATITTRAPAAFLASGSAELVGAEAEEVGTCRIQIDGTNSLQYSSAPDDIGANNQFVIAVNFAVTRPAGTYVANLQCESGAGTVTATAEAINVSGLGT